MLTVDLRIGERSSPLDRGVAMANPVEFFTDVYHRISISLRAKDPIQPRISPTLW